MNKHIVWVSFEFCYCVPSQVDAEVWKNGCFSDVYKHKNQAGYSFEQGEPSHAQYKDLERTYNEWENNATKFKDY